MSIELKIKSKHLSEEARIIRFEENKLLNNMQYRRAKHKEAGHNGKYDLYKDRDHQVYCSISHHRKCNVRNENRATFLARAYIANIPYNTVEQKRKPENEITFQKQVLPRVFAMVVKYGYGKISGGDREWEKSNQGGRYIATKQLKDKIIDWCKLD
jgi:hypothetical protein